jgi:hypothetical protein
VGRSIADFQLRIEYARLTKGRLEFGNRQLAIGNTLTHPLPRVGTDAIFTPRDLRAVSSYVEMKVKQT